MNEEEKEKRHPLRGESDFYPNIDYSSVEWSEAEKIYLQSMGVVLNGAEATP